MKVLAIIAVILICAAIVAVGATYPRYSREMEAARDRLVTGSSILKTDHGDIEYSVRGEGEPVLLLHGAGGGYDQGFWGGKVFFGQDDHKLISVSRFGYLRSPIPAQASIRTQASLYKVLLDHLRVGRVIVVGISAGGPSAMQFANDYPDRCRALVLLSAVSMARSPGDKDPFFIGLIHLIQQSDYAYWVFTKFMQPVILDLMGIPAKVYRNFAPEQKSLAQEMLDIMHPMSPRYKGTINDGDMIQAEGVSTDRVVAPALIIHAKDDALVSFAHAENSHARIKASILLSFDSGGHAMLSERENIRDHLRDFLKNRPDERPAGEATRPIR